MLFKGPMAKTAGGFLIALLASVATLLLFTFISVKFEESKITKMEEQLSGCTKIYNLIKDYPYRKVEFTQDGKMALIDKENQKLITFTLQDQEQLDVLRTIKGIYKDDSGVSFVYSNNIFAYVTKYVFTEKDEKNMRGKGGANETITKKDDGVYEVIYRFNYAELLTPEQLQYQFGGLFDEE